MNNTENQSGKFEVLDNQDVDLKVLFTAIWRRKLTVIVITFVFSLSAIIGSLLMPNIYRSEALLAPVSSDSGGIGGIAGQLGGLASLAGVNLSGSDGTDKTTLGIEVLKSRAFFAEFLDKYDVLVPLMAAKGWDEVSQDIIIDANKYDIETNTWVRTPKPPRKAKPSVQESHEEFLKLLIIDQDTDTGFIALSMEHYSPIIAQQWTQALVKEINESIRNKDVLQAQRSIDYLEQQIATTTLAELQVGFFDMIQNQTETIMLANASPEYLFKTIDPAVVPELKAKPKRAIICILGAFLGVVMGIFVVLVRYFLSDE